MSDAQVHDYYGVPLWLMKSYLADLGATEVSEQIMATDGWRAELSKAPVKRIGSLAVGGTTASFTGDPVALGAMFERLHWKTWRGGG